MRNRTGSGKGRTPAGKAGWIGSSNPPRRPRRPPTSRKRIASPPPPATNVTEADRIAARESRATRRAFDGAPPVIPHAITQESSSACLVCHGEGLAVKDRVAPRISHAHHASCTQCHIPSDGAGIPVVERALQLPIIRNDFAVARPAVRGSRAWPQAPPTVPHPTLMRSDCLSCHGPRGLPGLRTPHPERQACLQCHVPDARIDQRNFQAASVAGQNQHQAEPPSPELASTPGRIAFPSP